MKQMQYTIRNVTPELDAKLRAKAKREAKSLNRFMLEQLERSVHKPLSQLSMGTDYNDLVGSWQEEPSFDEAMKDMRVVDPRDW